MCNIGEKLGSVEVRTQKPIVGFRRWTLRSKPYPVLTPRVKVELQGTGYGIDFLWKNLGPNKKMCFALPGKAMYNCSCGFYAKYKPCHKDRPLSKEVLGVIFAWGEVVVYTDGFRAEYASIQGIVIPHLWDRLAIRRGLNNPHVLRSERQMLRNFQGSNSSRILNYDYLRLR